jgi:hypothetical protein
MLDELRWPCLSSSAQLGLSFGIGVEDSEKQIGARAMNCGWGEDFQEFHLGDGVRFWGWGEKFAGVDDKAVGGRAYVVKREASDQC